MGKLYHYIHCPFCIRVRMALGALNKNYQSEVLSYDDEETPIALTGVKMLPIFEDEDGPQNESLDIIRKLDKDDYLGMSSLKDSHKLKDFEELLNRLASPIHNLAMPYWVYSKEFNDSARKYFLKKKEAKRGPFNLLAQRKAQFLKELSPLLTEVESHIDPFFDKNSKVTIWDIILASHLWGLYMIPEFQFSPRLHSYLQQVGEHCHFNYHEDFWRE